MCGCVVQRLHARYFMNFRETAVKAWYVLLVLWFSIRWCCHLCFAISDCFLLILQTLSKSNLPYKNHGGTVQLLHLDLGSLAVRAHFLSWIHTQPLAWLMLLQPFPNKVRTTVLCVYGWIIGKIKSRALLLKSIIEMFCCILVNATFSRAHIWACAKNLRTGGPKEFRLICL